MIHRDGNQGGEPVRRIFELRLAPERRGHLALDQLAAEPLFSGKVGAGPPSLRQRRASAFPPGRGS